MSMGQLVDTFCGQNSLWAWAWVELELEHTLNYCLPTQFQVATCEAEMAGPHGTLLVVPFVCSHVEEYKIKV